MENNGEQMERRSKRAKVIDSSPFSGFSSSWASDAKALHKPGRHESASDPSARSGK